MSTSSVFYKKNQNRHTLFVKKYGRYFYWSPPPSFRKKIQAYLQQPPQAPIILELDNRRYVVKFSRREPGRLWRESLSALGCKILLGQTIRPSAFRTGDIRYEAQRLRKLYRLNLNVPFLYLSHPDYIVMEYCGSSIEPLLKDPAQHTDLLPRIVDSLVQLHQANQWHGGAQIRNLTLKQNTLFRIDFEERIGDALALELAQAYDVLLCFSSLSKHLNFDLELGEKLLRRYLQQRPHATTQATLQRLLNQLLGLARITQYLPKTLRHNQDIQRTHYFIAILQRSLQKD